MKKEEVVRNLVDRGYKSQAAINEFSDSSSDELEAGDKKMNFEYLLGMAIMSLTLERVE